MPTRGYAEKEGDARTFNQKVRILRSPLVIYSCCVQLRPPVDPRELEIDSSTGMKVSAKLPGGGMRVDGLALRITWPLKIAVGTLPLRSSAVPSASASRKAAVPGVEMGLSFGKLTDFLDKVSIPSRTSLPTATGQRSLCVSSVTTKSSVTSATTVGTVNEDPNTEKLILSFSISLRQFPRWSGSTNRYRNLWRCRLLPLPPRRNHRVGLFDGSTPSQFLKSDFVAVRLVSRALQTSPRRWYHVAIPLGISLTDTRHSLRKTTHRWKVLRISWAS